MPRYTATVTVAQKTFNAKTQAESESEAYYKIRRGSERKFPAQKVHIGRVLAEDDTVTMFRNLFKI